METNVLYNDDCIFADKYLEKDSVDLFLFSPPYADLRNYGHEDSQVSPDNYVEWFLPKARVFKELLKDTGSMIININDCVRDRFRHLYVFELVVALCKEVGFHLFERTFWDSGCSPPSPKGRFRNTTEYILWFAKTKDFKFYVDRGRVPYNKDTIKRYQTLVPVGHTRNLENEICPICGKQLICKSGKQICSSCGFGKQIKMKKVELNPLGALPSTLLQIGSESQRVGLHNAVFPISLPNYIIPMVTDIGDLVVDPFMGLGTTILSAIKLERGFVGFEIVKSIYDEASERINPAQQYRESKEYIF